MSVGIDRQLLVALHQQDTGVADLSRASWTSRREAETGLKKVFVFVARCESRAAGLGPADTAAADRAVDSWSVERGHFFLLSHKIEEQGV